MASHTEPTGPHTMDELMHPGRDHHVKQTSSGDVACPDPSAHRDTKLQEQASTAALYATNPPKKDILDKDGKLSSSSAAMSLKRAQAQDLPSFPVVGINSDSAGGAALLANKNQKPFEHWKPDASSAASAAAMKAKDYKMKPLWQPELSAAGSKAALLAHKDGGKLDLWYPSATAEGNSAATQAMKKNLSPQLDYGYTKDGRNRALMAATGALNSGRARSGSTPAAPTPVYPDAINAKHNALNAATVAHRPSTKQTDSDRLDSDAMEAARIRHIQNVPREMWTEKPPVEIEQEEKRHQAALRASAVSMAKGMYDYQQRHAEGQDMSPQRMGVAAATMSQARASNDTAAPLDMRQQAMQYIHLQEAAQKLADERLAKMDPDGAARFREHYGYSLNQPSKSRMSLRGRGRKRAGSEATNTTSNANDDDSSDDEMTARRIRSQMQGLSRDLETADEQKRKTDRAALLAAAEKKVHLQMHNMDEKVFAETGKVSPAMMEQWEAKARAKAKTDSDQRMVNHGKTAIGGGRYMDQSEIEAIALARLKPTLDEITDTAEKRRARDEELRLDAEQKRREEEDSKRKQRDTKMVEKQTRDEEKQAAKREKEEQKAAAKREKEEKKQSAKTGKELEKSRKAEEQRLAKENEVKRKAAETHLYANSDPVAVVAKERKSTNTEASEGVEQDQETTVPAPLERQESLLHQTSPTGERQLRPDIERHVTNVETSESEGEDEPVVVSHADADGDVFTEPKKSTKQPEVLSPASPASNKLNKDKGESRGLGRLFSKIRRKSQLAPKEASGSAGIATFSTADPTDPVITDSVSPQEALASSKGVENARAASPSSFKRGRGNDSVSSLSSSGREEEGLSSMLSRGRRGKSATRHSSEDEFEEARDNFDESLAPPPAFGGQAKSTSPVRETKFQEEL